MDLTLLTPEPHVLPAALALIVLGAIGYLAVRRWRLTIGLIVPCVGLLAWRILAGLMSVSAAAAQPDLRHYVLPDFFAGGIALLVGIGLPLAAWRHRSRPAA